MNDLDRISDSVPVAVLEPLSRRRVMETLERLGLAYRVDRDTEVSAEWDHATYWFSIAGEASNVLSVTGYWRGWLPAEYRDELPKAHLGVDGDEDQHILVEHAVGYEFGVTDEQLYQHIGMTVHPGNLFFAEMSETYPGGVG
ncbi:YbjN domain-containing protein [Corynebacterium sp. USCH3]|uniref:YbjN domain-containing protein n=1 Tax=Corynebacterium sp. USCH3 TaxID=3024840 RepID=UPI0030A50FCA